MLSKMYYSGSTGWLSRENKRQVMTLVKSTNR